MLIQSKSASPVTIQKDLKEILESDAKEESLLKDIQNQLKSWDEVQTLYTLMTSAKSNIHNISSSFDYDIKEIENLSASTGKRKETIQALVTKLQVSINDLKTKEEEAKDKTQQKTNIKHTLDQAQALVRSLTNEINSDVTKKQQLINEDARLKDRKSVV